jgi:hypothetical protein
MHLSEPDGEEENNDMNRVASIRIIARTIRYCHNYLRFASRLLLSNRFAVVTYNI